MRSKISNLTLIVCLSLASIRVCAQWPVNSGSQGNITGTIGEVRGDGTRIHNGTDIDWSPMQAVIYSVQADQIATIGGSGNTKYIAMSSGITYTHVIPLDEIAMNQAEIDEINKGKRIIKLEAKDEFAKMLPDAPGFGSHVHITRDRENFLVNGFGVTGFVFNDRVKPRFGSIDPIKVYEAGSSDSQKRFKTYVDNNTDKPLIIWNDVDISVNTFQPWIGSGGNSLGSGHLAPYKLSYKLSKLEDGQIVLPYEERIRFGYGLSGSDVNITDKIILTTLHAKGSTSGDPIWLISNKFLDGAGVDDKFATNKYSDGEYKLTIKVEGAPTSSAENTEEKSIDLIIDNFKTYIQKVSVKSSKGIVKYLAQWSKLKSGSDGSISLDERNSESFTGGEQVLMEVTTSERVPSLMLTAGTMQIPLSQSNTDGTLWTCAVTLPNSNVNKNSKKLQLEFQSGDRLFSLKLGNNSADVSRNIKGKFQDDGSKGIDTNHELNVCPSDYDLTLEVDIQGNTTANLIAKGGLQPYLYSIDVEPFQPVGKSIFTSVNSYTIDYNKNYLFKVKDKEECQSEEYYTLTKTECNATNLAGGQGTDIKSVPLGTTSGLVRIVYDMYSIPDQITVEYRGTTQTTGIVSGSGELSFMHTYKKGGNNSCTITMYAPNSGTAWQYVVNCPSSAGRVAALPETKNYELRYGDGIVVINSLVLEDTRTYTINYRVVGEKKWHQLSNIKLPFNLQSGNKEMEVKLDVDTEKVKYLRVSPNPSSGPLNFEYNSLSKGDATLTIYNLNGELLYTSVVTIKKGLNEFSWKPVGSIQGLILVNVRQDSVNRSVRAIIDR